jgi:hypothetical protein
MAYLSSAVLGGTSFDQSDRNQRRRRGARPAPDTVSLATADVTFAGGQGLRFLALRMCLTPGA